MSKTIRRKSKKLPDHWLMDIVKLDCKYGKYWGKVETDPNTVKKLTAKYHSDSGDNMFMGNAPKHYRKMLDRSKRAKESAELKRILKSTNYEDYSFMLRKKDANYNWW